MKAGENQTLLTDLYQLTMAQAYFREQRAASATFSLFIRSYPTDRGYFVSAGLQDVLDYLEGFSFDVAAIDFLDSQKIFSPDFRTISPSCASPARYGRYPKDESFLPTSR
jgi:nicotinate phosphoribosyltransferase